MLRPGKMIEEKCRMLQATHKRCLVWARNNGALFVLRKCCMRDTY